MPFERPALVKFDEPPLGFSFGPRDTADPEFVSETIAGSIRPHGRDDS